MKIMGKGLTEGSLWNIKLERADIQLIMKSYFPFNWEQTSLIKKRATRLDPWEIFVLLALKNSVSFYLVQNIRKLPSILYDNRL